MKKIYTTGWMSVFALAIAAANGCIGFAGPGVGVMSIPIPITPYQQQLAEDYAYETARYKRVAVLSPITEENHIALDPPPDDQVIRALEKARPVAGAIPGLETTCRNIRGIEKELIADYVDPPRVYPLIGPAQLHHAHYKCTIYFTETTNVSWPIPHEIKVENGIEVLWIDKDHLHRVGGGDDNSPAL